MADAAGRGAFVVFVGPDGVGKTSAARALIDATGGPTGYFHFRPPVIGGLAPSVPVEQAPLPKHRGRPGTLTGIVRLGVSFLRFWLGHLRTVAPAVRGGSLVVADRWAYGYLVQPNALRFHGPAWLARLIVRLLPKPDLVISLTAPVDVIRARKQELSEREIAEELEAWAALPTSRLLSVDATQPPAAIADQVLAALAGAVGGPRYVRFPPGRGTLLLPADSRGGLRAGIAMWSACRRGPRLFQRLSHIAAGVAGPAPFRLLGTEEWDRPVPPDVWDAVGDQLAEWFGPTDSMALYRPPQAERQGFAGLLTREGAAVGFFKCRPEWDFGPESEVVGALGPARTFTAPALVGTARFGRWSVIAFTPLPDGLHLPGASGSVAGITREISALVAPVLGEPPVAGWVPMHGDLGPWNLRHLARQDLVFDWERAAYGPPGADEVFHFAATRAVGLPAPGLSLDAYPEARAFWTEEIGGRRQVGGDARLATAMLAALASG